MQDIDKLFNRLNELLDRVEKIVPARQPVETQTSFRAYRWVNHGLQGIANFDRVDREDLLHIERQKDLISRNTAQFLQGKPANNTLLWGARGTGKSSLIKAQLSEFTDPEFCVVEIPKSATGQLFEIIKTLGHDNRQFIIYLDDLSFESNDDSYKALKACLEGSLQPQPANVLIYATSNRRHLMPELMKDNLDSTMVDGQLHPSETIEEKVSLSDRFGLWLSFHPFTQDQYLTVVEQTLQSRNQKMDEDTRMEAIRFATSRGSRSGRIAFQFAAYWASLRD
ncbi:MAG: ATP-binding protein [Gammaproteobacteria bacterium]|nr:ATP-binding protein [Gammaproteobacteria bacterium]MCZ6798741.1 ATP-binding protein [Gammaproteobacteria bacterium]MCZ6882638.1 ATP-binding protein [Gammaproteobacteria bacterium]